MMSVRALAASAMTVSFRSNPSTLSSIRTHPPILRRGAPTPAFPKERRVFQRLPHDRRPLLNEQSIPDKFQDRLSILWRSTMLASSCANGSIISKTADTLRSS